MNSTFRVTSFFNSNHYLIVVFSGLFLVGCGSSSDEKELLLTDPYQEKSGDAFTSTTIMDFEYSTGVRRQVVNIDVDTYSIVDEIPQKYGYSGALSGPYLLETNHENDELDSLRYMTLDGEWIIDDDLDSFTSIETTSRTGSDDPENIYIGDEFSARNSSILYSSDTGLEIGSEVLELDFVILNEEVVTVPAGTFTAIKIDYSTNFSSIENSVVATQVADGHMWVDERSGILVKMVMTNGVVTISDPSINATFELDFVLDSYTLSENEPEVRKRTRSMSELSNGFDIDVNGLVNQLKHQFGNIQN